MVFQRIRDNPLRDRASVADSDDLTSFDSPDLRGMRICNLATAYDGRFKHAVFRSGILRSSA